MLSNLLSILLVLFLGILAVVVFIIAETEKNDRKKERNL